MFGNTNKSVGASSGALHNTLGSTAGSSTMGLYGSSKWNLSGEGGNKGDPLATSTKSSKTSGLSLASGQPASSSTVLPALAGTGGASGGPGGPSFKGLKREHRYQQGAGGKGGNMGGGVGAARRNGNFPKYGGSSSTASAKYGHAASSLHGNNGGRKDFSALVEARRAKFGHGGTQHGSGGGTTGGQHKHRVRKVRSKYGVGVGAGGGGGGSSIVGSALSSSALRLTALPDRGSGGGNKSAYNSPSSQKVKYGKKNKYGVDIRGGKGR